MKRSLKVSFWVSFATVIFVAMVGQALAADWPQNRPITMVIWYAAGGGTDMNARVYSAGMEKYFKEKYGWKATINCINKPGATGAMAADFVYSKPANGYWLMAGSQFGAQHRVMGYSKLVLWKDWQYFGAFGATGVLSVPVNSPFKTMTDFIEACKKEPGKYRVSNSGVGGVWHQQNEGFKAAAKVKWQEVPYKGGAPGVLACLQGEVDVASSGLHEVIEFVRAGKMRVLCTFRQEPITIDTGAVLQPASTFVPGMDMEIYSLGGGVMGLKRDTPVDVLEKIRDAFVYALDTPEYQNLLKQKYFYKNLKVGEDADRAGALYESVTAWMYWDLKMQGVKANPKDLGIPRPEDFNKWWPPKEYKPRLPGLKKK